MGCEPLAPKFPLGGDEVPGPAREGGLRGQGRGESSLGPRKAALDLGRAGSVSTTRAGFNSVRVGFGEGEHRVGHPRRRSDG